MWDPRGTTYRSLRNLRDRLGGIRREEYVRFLHTCERLPRERLLELQWEKLKRLLDHAYAQVPFYRDRFRQIGAHPGDIRNLADFALLPLLTRADLLEHRDRLVAANISRRDLRPSSTGGSTGRPVQFYLDRQYDQWGNAIVQVQDSWAGFRPGERHAFLWGSRIDLSKQKERLPDRLRNRLSRTLYLDSFEMKAENLEAYIDRLVRFHPRLLTGYVLPLQLLARRMVARGVPGGWVGAVQTGAEPLNPAQRSLIQEAFHAPVFERYGGRDIGALAHECEAHQGMHLFSLNYLVEAMAVDGRTDDTRELVVTHLDNFGFPFIRYRSEDEGVLSDRACPCGRTWSMVERIRGRVVEVVVGVNGQLLSGEFFPHLFKDYDVGEFQVVQREAGSLEVSLVKGRSLGPDELDRLRAIFRRYLGEEMQVVFHLVEAIPRSASGKFRVVISELARPETPRPREPVDL